MSISAFSYDGTVSWSGQVPNSIPEGDYYIGWIIDAMILLMNSMSQII